MTLAAGAIKDAARYADLRVVVRESASDGRGGLRLARDVEDKQHRDAEQPRQIGSRTCSVRLAANAVKEPHGTFDDQQLGVLCMLDRQVTEQFGRHGPAIEIEPGHAGGRLMEAGSM